MAAVRLLVCAGAAALATCAAAAHADAGAALAFTNVQGADFGDARIRGRETALRLWSREFAFDRVAFRAGADYAYTHFEYDNLPTRDRDLHRLHLPLQWRARDDRWRLVLTPVVATSSNVFQDLAGRGGRDDIDVYGRWRFERWSSAARGWRIALVRDAAFGKPRAYPAAALLWRGERIDAEVGLPETRVDWRLRDDFVLGATIHPAGGRWHVISDERGGAEFDYIVRGWRAGVGAQWSPLPRWHVSAQVGVEFRRRHRFEDDTGAAIDRSAGSAATYRLSLGIGF